MKLPKHEAKRFFELFDLVTIFAHHKLSVCDDAVFWSSDSPRGISEEGQRATTEALWNNIGVLDEFLIENPVELSFEDLAIIASWKDAYSHTFFVDKDKEGHLLFLDNEHLFDVYGLSLEIDDMFKQVPTMVSSTLLPFGDYVVYGMFIMEFPVHMGSGMLEVVKKGFDDALAAGNIVRNARDFAAVVPAVKEEEIQREIDDMLNNLELDQRSDDLAEGQHEGMLAGLSSEEREQAIEDYYNSEDYLAELEAQGAVDDASIQDELDEKCIEGPLCTSLSDLLEADKGMSPSRFVELFGMLEFEDLGLDSEDDPEIRKRFDEMKAVVVEEEEIGLFSENLKATFCDPERLKERFRRVPVYQVNALRKLAEAGGRLSIPTESEDLYDAPMPQKGLCYLFKGNGVFEFVMPDEVVPIVANFDWDAWEAYVDKRIGLTKFVAAITELRGICSYVDVINEYAQLCPGGFQNAQEIHDEIESLLHSGLFDMLLLDTGDEVYLLHEDLAWLYLDNQNLDPYGSERMVEGQLDEMLDNLLKRQQEKEPRPVEASMIEDTSIYRWKENLPAARTLRSYLDSHVPDTQNDYSFADEVLVELDDVLHWGIPHEGIKVFLETLEDYDFVPNEAQLKKLVDLFMNYANSMPTWANNGWAPSEMASKMYGHKIFYNEDGSVMKVGRNDPCPCGSGKKYKKCCGAH